MNMSPTNSLRLEGISLITAEGPLVEALSLTVLSGAVTTLMGASGSGKSSLLAYICGTLAPDFSARGEVFINDVNVTRWPPERRQVGILFQDDLLYPHLSVGDNLAFALSARCRGRRMRRQRIEEALAEAGLAGFAERDPATLSGGQRARVALLRTLLSQPKVLLLDEPFSKLDAETRQQFRQFVFSHARACGLPTLMVTHDPEDAAAAEGEVVRLAVSA